MTGVAQVTDSGSAHSQTTADARGDAECSSAIIGLRAVADSLSGVSTPVGPAPGGGGTLSDVQAAGGGFGGDVMQFFQPAITIHAGDTVKWTNPNGAPLVAGGVVLMAAIVLAARGLAGMRRIGR